MCVSVCDLLGSAVALGTEPPRLRALGIPRVRIVPPRLLPCIRYLLVFWLFISVLVLLLVFWSVIY